MKVNLDDKREIDALINGWMYRDIGEWDKLLELFHDDGVIEVTWFEGLFRDFVAASRRMGASGLKTKHLIGVPSVISDGDRAISETNAVILVDNDKLDFGCAVHNRFFDMVERRGGEWRIVKRQSIYDMGTFTFPYGPAEIDGVAARRYPRAYAPLAYVLEKSGVPVKRVFATKGGELEANMRRDALTWLASSV